MPPANSSSATRKLRLRPRLAKEPLGSSGFQLRIAGRGFALDGRRSPELAAAFLQLDYRFLIDREDPLIDLTNAGSLSPPGGTKNTFSPFAANASSALV